EAQQTATSPAILERILFIVELLVGQFAECFLVRSVREDQSLAPTQVGAATGVIALVVSVAPSKIAVIVRQYSCPSVQGSHGASKDSSALQTLSGSGLVSKVNIGYISRMSSVAISS